VKLRPLGRLDLDFDVDLDLDLDLDRVASVWIKRWNDVAAGQACVSPKNGG